MSAARDPVIAAATARLMRGWRLRIWLAVATLFGLGLTRLPLFGVLGFEHAVAVAILGSLAGLDLGATLARRVVGQPAPGLARAIAPWRLIVAVAGRAVGLALAVTAVPSVIAAIHGAWAPTCDWWFGLQAVALLPLASAALAAGLGVAISLIVGPRRIVSTVAPWLTLLAIAALGVWRFYSAPPVFSYSPILGYFPGNLYDEDVRLGTALWAARAEQLAIVVSLLAACALFADAPTLRLARGARPRGWRLGEFAVLTTSATVAAVLRLNAGVLGYAVDAADIQDELDGVVRTPHFVIHYAHRPDIDADLPLIAADHEFRLAQVTRTLGVAPSEIIDSYYFPDDDAKARWMGARRVEMAKPWRHEIYLNHEGFPHGALRHELAHVVAGEFGDPWFAVSAGRFLGMPLFVNPGMIEGLAFATDWPGDYRVTLTPHEQVRAMELMGTPASVDTLFSLGFLSVAPARSYATGGSFLRFLLDRYGAGPLRVLYESGGDFGAAYGRPQAALAGEWHDMIGAITLSPDQVEQVRERFRYPSVFERPCPHAIAARSAAAVDALGDGDPARAIALLRTSCAEEPDEPRHRMELARALDRGDADERAEAAGIWTEVAADSKRISAAMRARALVELARRAAATGDWAATRAAVDRGRALPLDDDNRRMLDGMHLALDHGGPAAGAFRGYFFGGGDQQAWATLITVVEPSLAMGWYLHGLWAHLRGDHATATRDLRRALVMGLPGRNFTREAARRLLISAWRVEARDIVLGAADALAGAGASEMDRLAAQDWRERVAWTRTGALP